MIKNAKTAAAVAQIFNDLDKYLLFCQNYGFNFNEADLYNGRSFSFRQYQRSVANKPFVDQWNIDREKFQNQR